MAVLSVALEGKAQATQDAYLADLRAGAVFAGYRGPGDALESFLALDAGDAYAAAVSWHGAMETAKLAPRTVARRLSTLRSVVRSAARQGAVNWTLDIEGPTIAGFVRDTRGPPAADVAHVLAMLEAAGREAGAQLAIRDLAVMLLLHDSALRCSEVCSLDVRHVDMAAALVQVAAKGAGGGRIWWPMSPRCKRAMARWFRARGRQPGPVFCSVGIGRDSRGIGRKTVYRRVVFWAAEAGFQGWKPHGLRHAAITKLKRETGDLDRAQRFARHASPTTTTGHYIDAEPDAVRDDVAVVARKGRRSEKKRQ